MNQAKKLPTIQIQGHNYTIDFKLKEIREYVAEFIISHIPFSSVKGTYILTKYRRGKK